MSKTPPIRGFKQKGTRFLSNMYPAPIFLYGMYFGSVEAAFQASKATNPLLRERFTELDGYEARKLGRRIQLRLDWEYVKLPVMREVLAQKFAIGSALGMKLIETGDAELIEENTHDDRFWGVCNGVGKNWLGRLLMERRDYLQHPSIRGRC